MSKRIIFFRNIMVVIFSLYSFMLIAQTQITEIKLIDSELKEPISFAHYTIGNYKGVTDTNGFIRIEGELNDDLYISHIQYGYVIVSRDELLDFVNEGSLPLSKKDVSIQPAVVMGLHSSKYPDENMELNYQDLLSHDAGAFLERNPSLSSVKKSGSYGFDPVFRGFKNEQLNIIIDGGQNATAACPNRMDPPSSQISLNMMERVEVLKGPFSLRYGNSFGGTIHFISSTPDFSLKPKAFGRLSGSYEGNGSIYRGEGMVGTKGKWYQIKLFGSHSEGSAYKDGDGVEVPASFARTSIGASTDFKLTKNQILTFSATNNIAKDVDFPSLPMDLRSDNTLLINAKHSINFNHAKFKSINTMVYGSFVDHEMDNYKRISPPADAITEAQTVNYGGRSEISMDIYSGFLYAGVDYRRTEQEGERTRVVQIDTNMSRTFVDNVWQGAVMNKTGVFVEYHKQVAGVRLVGAIRLTVTSSELTNPADEFVANYNETSLNQNNFSASIGANKLLNESVEVGLWLGRAQRTGGLTELYINYFPVGLDAYEMLGNPGLSPETNNQIDLIFKWRTERAVIDVDLFGSYLQDYISSEIREDLMPRMKSAPGVRQYKNIEKAFMTGFEASWKQSLFFNLKQRLAVVYTFAEDIETNTPLPEIPPLEFNYNLIGSYLKDRLSPEIGVRYVLSQNRISKEFGESSTPEFFLFDLKLNYRPIENISLTAGVVNLFDKAYYEHLSRATKVNDKGPLYSPGRNVYVTATYSF